MFASKALPCERLARVRISKSDSPRQKGGFKRGSKTRSGEQSEALRFAPIRGWFFLMFPHPTNSFPNHTHTRQILPPLSPFPAKKASPLLNAKIGCPPRAAQALEKKEKDQVISTPFSVTLCSSITRPTTFAPSTIERTVSTLSFGTTNAKPIPILNVR